MIYDDRGRLKNFGSVNYKINGLGQRLQKDNSGFKVRFVYNESEKLMGEYDGGDATVIEHSWRMIVKTYIAKEDNGRLVAFEIEAIYYSRSAIAKILNAISGVSNMQIKGRFGSNDDVRIMFNFLNTSFIVR